MSQWKKLQWVDTCCDSDYDSYELVYNGVTVIYNVHEQKEFIIAPSWDDADMSEQWYASEEEVIAAIDSGDYSKFRKPFKYTKAEVITENNDVFRLSFFVPMPNIHTIYDDVESSKIVQNYVADFVKNNFKFSGSIRIIY